MKLFISQNYIHKISQMLYRIFFYILFTTMNLSYAFAVEFIICKIGM